jgi:hypothetical protein
MAWVNVGKSMPAHLTALQTADEIGADVVHIQEPWTAVGTLTQTHPSYESYAPVDTWNNEETWGSDRPRVLSYVRRGARIKAQQRRPLPSRDLLWLEINGYLTLNAYRQPTTPEVMDYVTRLTPQAACLVGGDFNCKHDMFQPGTITENRGEDLAQWSLQSGMDFTGMCKVPGGCLEFAAQRDNALIAKGVLKGIG